MGWGLSQRVVSWVAWKGKVWLFLKVGRWDFKKILRNNVLVVWDGVVGERGWLYFLLRYGDSMKIFSQENIL